MTKVTWEQLENTGCPDCGAPLSDMQHHEDGALICSLCPFIIYDTEIENWVSGMEECRICGHKNAFIAPSICDLDNMECTNCHCMTSEIVDE